MIYKLCKAGDCFSSFFNCVLMFLASFSWRLGVGARLLASSMRLRFFCPHWYLCLMSLILSRFFSSKAIFNSLVKHAETIMVSTRHLAMQRAAKAKFSSAGTFTCEGSSCVEEVWVSQIRLLLALFNLLFTFSKVVQKRDAQIADTIKQALNVCYFFSKFVRFIYGIYFFSF